MAGEINLEQFEPLTREASDSFRVDPSYAIAMAKQAGALNSRREAKALREQDQILDAEL